MKKRIIWALGISAMLVALGWAFEFHPLVFVIVAFAFAGNLVIDDQNIINEKEETIKHLTKELHLTQDQLLKRQLANIEIMQLSTESMKNLRLDLKFMIDMAVKTKINTFLTIEEEIELNRIIKKHLNKNVPQH